MSIVDSLHSGFKRLGAHFISKSSSHLSHTSQHTQHLTVEVVSEITEIEVAPQEENLRKEQQNHPLYQIQAFSDNKPEVEINTSSSSSSSSSLPPPNDVNNNIPTPVSMRKQTLIAPCEVEALTRRKDIKSSLNVVTATACCPKKPNKSRATTQRRDCGEDAVFVCRKFPPRAQTEGNASTNEMTRVCCIGVADGVGSYMLRGIDPSIFAWAIMEGTRSVFETDRDISCYDALSRSYDTICEEKIVLAGGSTACVVSIHHGTDSSNGMPVLKLTGANLGDSSFMVIRNKKIIFRSEEQLHGYNCPYQLSVPRDFTNLRQDSPTKAVVLDELDLIRGDIVIVTTDGLTDNVFDEEVARIISEIKETTSKETAAKMASELLKTAYVNSRSKDSYTPFTKYARENKQKYIPSGKVDDITFVVALVD